MADTAPDYSVANNPHCMIHCGPVGPESVDDGRDLTIVTSTDCQVVYGKSGNKVEHIQGHSAETCGHSIDPEQKDAVAKAILAENGDIIFIAEAGNIRFKARNIYMETSGDTGQGNIIASANGQITLATGGEVRLSGGDICIRGQKGINLVTEYYIRVSGKIMEGGAASTGSLISNFIAGNWASLITGITQSCK